MALSVTVMNGDDAELDLADDATYGDVLEALGLNPAAAVVVVDGRPVPEGDRVAADDVTVMRTVSGGSDRRARPDSHA